MSQRTVFTLLRVGVLSSACLFASMFACGDDKQGQTTPEVDTRDSAGSETAEVTTEPDATDTRDATEPLDVEDAPDLPDAPDTADTHGDTPDLADADEVADTEDDSAIEVTDADDVQDTIAPDAPDAPDAVDVSDAPDADDTPDSADSTDTVTPPSGESCVDPLPVTLPATWTAAVVVTGDTSSLADDHDVAAGACPGVDWELGLGVSDEVWALTAPVAGSYEVTLTSANADLALYLLKGCTADDEGTCARAADAVGTGVDGANVARVALAAGETVFVVVDAFALTPPPVGAYQLEFAAPVATPLGDTCGNAIAIQPGPVGFVGTGDFGPDTALSDDYDASGCGAFFDGAGVQDQVWRFTAPASKRYRVTITPTAGTDPMLYFFDDATCSGTCSGHVDDFSGGVAESATVDLVMGDDLFIVVDAWLPEAGGQYVLAIVETCTPSCAPGSCADDGCGERCACDGGLICNDATDVCEVCAPSCGNACGVPNGCGGVCGCDIGQRCDPVASECFVPSAGDTCDDAVAMKVELDGTLTAAGDLTSGRGDDVVTGSCEAIAGLPFDGDGTPDETWKFTVPSDGRYTIEVLSDPDVDVYFMLFTGPGCLDAACLGAVDDGLAGESDKASFDLTNAATYTLAVDTWSVEQAGAYTIRISEAPAVVTGDGCEAPYTLNEVPGSALEGNGDLSAVDIDDPDEFEVGSCGDLGNAAFPPDGVDTPDEVFGFDVPTTGTYKITVTPDEFIDVFVQLMAGPSCDAAACVGYQDDAFSGAAEIVTVSLSSGTSYWLVVDTYQGFAAGPYSVRIEPTCAPVCTAGACGADGCGGTCPCGSGEECSAEVCVPKVGDSCAEPATLSMAGPPWLGSGDLSETGVADDFDFLTCADLGDSFPPDGVDTLDEVIEFKVPSDGGYIVSVSPDTDLDVAWSLWSGSTCEAATCGGYLDAVESGGAEVATVSLLAATTYWLVVDMYALSTPGPYSVTLTPVPVAGESCDAPFLLELGIPRSGITTGTNDDYAGAACGGNIGGAGQGDLVYYVKLPVAGDYQVTVTPSGGADLALYALGVDGASCNEGVCLDGANDAGVNGAETIAVTAATADSAAYVVVDGATVPGEFDVSTATTISACAADLMFTQYNEPSASSGNRKSVEIFNGTANAVSLSGYSIRRANNGNTSGVSVATITFTANASIQPGETWVVCNDGTGFPNGACDQSGVVALNFNGNDALSLMKGTTVIDEIGKFGENPGDAGWTVGSGTTVDVTLVRKPAVRAGTTDWAVGATQWLVRPVNEFTDLGAHDYFWQCAP